MNSKVVHVLIWGAGINTKKLLSVFPDNYVIDAFIETKPTKRYFKGIPVAGIEEFLNYYERTNITIITPYDNKEIIDYIKRLELYKNIYIAADKNMDYFYSFYRGNKVKRNDLFDVNKSCNISDYVVCKCDNINFIVNNNYKMMIDSISYGNNYQQKDMELFVHLSEKYYGIKKDVEGYFIDIGANIGTTSIWVKKKINNKIKLIAFEPIKENYKQYEINCILNDILKEDYFIIDAAVSDKNTESKCMLSDEGNMGDNRIIINGNEDKNKETEVVKTVRLDDWLEENKIEKSQIKYIWMDVQAHEGFVFSGGLDTFMNNNIPVFMEFWPIELIKNNSLELLIENIKKCYSKYIIASEALNGNLKEYDADMLYELAKNTVGENSYDLFLIK